MNAIPAASGFVAVYVDWWEDIAAYDIQLLPIIAWYEDNDSLRPIGVAEYKAVLCGGNSDPDDNCYWGIIRESEITPVLRMEWQRWGQKQLEKDKKKDAAGLAAYRAEEAAFTEEYAKQQASERAT